MSLDLYADDLVERVGNLTPTTAVEPGAFDGFFRGAGMATMRGFAQTERSVGMLMSAPFVAASKISDDTTLADRYFKAIDETLGSAVDYWTPKPNEVGVAGQVVGSLLSIIPQAIASPPLVALQSADVGTELVQKGVSAGKAAAVAGTMTAGMMAGLWMPILGNNLWQRTLIGGAGFNIGQGVATRGAAELILAGHPAAEEFKAFDPTSVTLDAVLGLAFGSFAHVSPTQRAAGKEAWETIGRWAQGMSPSDVAAVATLRTAQHLNTDSTPGTPVAPQDIDTHVQRMRAAVDQTLRGEPVDVQNIKQDYPPVLTDVVEEPPLPVLTDVVEPGRPADYPVLTDVVKEPPLPVLTDVVQLARQAAAGEPLFVVDAAKRAEQLKNAAELLAQADAARREEGLPRIADAPLRVPADVTALPHDLQALHVGEALALRLREGGMGADEASAHAAVWSAFFKTAAEKYGVAPADLLERYGVDVQRLNSAQNLPDALEQRGQAPNRYHPREIPEGERLTLEHQEVRKLVQIIADNEAGWATIGGRLDIERLIKEKGPDAVDRFGRPTTSAVAFTEWIPKAEWWTGRPGHPGRGLNETKTRAAVQKALAGEKLSKLERDTVDYLVDVVNERLAAERDMGDDRWNEVAAAAVDTGLEPTRQNVIDADVLARAVAIDRPAVEAAAARYVPTKDADAMMAEARRIIREHEEKQQAEAAGQQTAPAEPGGAAAAGGEGADGQTLYQRDEPGTWYYSELARQLDAAQIKSAPAKGWSDYLKSLPQKGVKAEEIRWSGLEDWLALQEGKVAKEQVTEFLKQGGVRVEEVMLGAGEQRTVRDADIRADVDLLERSGLTIDQDPAAEAEGVNRFGVIHDETGEIFAFPGDANEWRVSHEELVARTDDMAASIPDNVVDAIDRVLGYLNRGAPPASFADLGEQLRSRGWNYQGTPQIANEAGVEFRRTGDGAQPEPWISIDEMREQLGPDSPDVAIAERMIGLANGDSEGAVKPTKYGSYQLPGGKNYRELLLTMPPREAPPAKIDRNTLLPEGYHVEPINGNGWTLVGPDGSGRTLMNIADGLERWQATEAAIETLRQQGVIGPRGWDSVEAQERTFHSTHYDPENILAHVRFNERTDADGKRVLFLEELQSDWAKAARNARKAIVEKLANALAITPEEASKRVPQDAGVEDPKRTAKMRARAAELSTELDRLAEPALEAARKYIPEHLVGRANQADTLLGEMHRLETSGQDWAAKYGVTDPADVEALKSYLSTLTESDSLELQLTAQAAPPAPYIGKTEEWTALVLKRMIRYAAENGFERVAWTRGEQQVERYTTALRHAVDQIEWTKTDKGVQQPAFDLTPELKRRALDGLPLFQGGGKPAQPPRGSITFGKDRTLIALFEDANASTLVHESGHMFLQMTRDLATREGVPPEAAQDWATLASWLKIEGGDIPREAHEQFARGWEKYLQEGVAPNEALRSVFQRFRDWLLEVYQRLAGRGLDAELSDDVRGVMARMLDSQARDPSQTAPEAPGATQPAAPPDARPQPNARQGAQPAPAVPESAPPGESPAPVAPSSSDGGGGTTPGGPAAEAPDMVANEAHRIALERPDLRIRIGTDEEGGAIYQSATDFLEAAKAEAAQARDDKRLITAAAECMLGTL